MRLFNAIDFGDYEANLPRPADGTCSWVLGCQQYKSWIAKEEATLLWITGDPGCGKTLLSAYLAEHLRSFSLDRNRAEVYFFFCDDTVPTQRDARSIVRCVLYQILQRHRSLLKHVKARYDIDGAAVANSFKALWDIFLKIAGESKFGTIKVIVDAIDECEEATRRVFLDAVTQLVHSYQRMDQRPRSYVKFLITSRPFLCEIYDFTGFTKSRLPMEHNHASIRGDIDKVIKSRVEKIAQRFQISNETKVFVEETLCSRSNQTFLWVDIILRHLEDSPMASKKDFEQIINTFPIDLEETYTKFLQLIPHKHELETVKILHLLIGSSRHLDLMEANIAFTIQRNHRTVAEVDADCQPSMIRTLHGLAGPLVRVTDSKVSFIHQTVKEFLTKLTRRSEVILAQKHSFDPTEGALTVASACIWYLSLQEFETDFFSDGRDNYETASPDSPILTWTSEIGPDTLEEDDIFKDTRTRDAEICRSLAQRYAFFDYAATHWGEHLSACEHIASKYVREAFVKLTKNNGCMLRNWLKYFWLKIDMEYSFPEYFDTVAVAAIFDLSVFLEDFLQEEHTRDQSSKDITLFWAARMGRAKSSQVLLLHGANPNCRGPDVRQTPLTVAALHGHVSVVNALLDDDRTEVNLKGAFGRTALSFAAGNGQGDIVQALLKRQDYDESDLDDGHWSPIFWAVQGNHTDIIINLLQRGTHPINQVDKTGRSAISWAAENGSLQSLKILLRHPDSDPNLKDDTGRSPLLWAASNGQTEVVSFLCRNNIVDKSSVNVDGRNAISMACQGGHRDTVRTLIKYGCPGVDQADADGWAPLAWALFNRSLPTVETLIGSGEVKINRRDNNGRSALWYAASYGYLDIVRLLLLEGADAEVIDNRDQTAIGIAKMNGHIEIVEVLKESWLEEEPD